MVLFNKRFKLSIISINCKLLPLAGLPLLALPGLGNKSTFDVVVGKLLREFVKIISEIGGFGRCVGNVEVSGVMGVAGGEI